MKIILDKDEIQEALDELDNSCDSKKGFDAYDVGYFIGTLRYHLEHAEEIGENNDTYK
jgi:hypothetical protein